MTETDKNASESGWFSYSSSRPSYSYCIHFAPFPQVGGLRGRILVYLSPFHPLPPFKFSQIFKAILVTNGPLVTVMRLSLIDWWLYSVLILKSVTDFPCSCWFPNHTCWEDQEKSGVTIYPSDIGHYQWTKAWES